MNRRTFLKGLAILIATPTVQKIGRVIAPVIPEPIKRKLRGVILYVGPGGDDANSGLAWQERIMTIQEAVQRAGPGSRIVVGPGVYRECITLGAKTNKGEQKV